jgi:uncharacterized membrane protein
MMIRTPPGWGAEMLTRAYQSATTARPDGAATRSSPVVIRRIDFSDLRWALARGIEDFGASRTDVIFLCVIYPLVGLFLARLAFGYELLPLVFPLASGFALVGPLAAVGLTEISRRRELGLPAGWADAFTVFRSPAIGGIVLLGLILLCMLMFWLVLSNAVYDATLGPKPPASVQAFVHDILYTRAGLTMMAVGVGTGFVFAAAVLAISVVSFPMMLDRNVSLETAIRTSVRVAARNPIVIGAWGIFIAAALVAGSLPLLLGLVLVVPVFGHATWHLYRRAIFG